MISLQESKTQPKILDFILKILIYIFKNLDFLYICARTTQRKKISSQFKMKGIVSHFFAPRVGENLEKKTDTESNVDLIGRSLQNHHLKILKGLKLLMTLFKKK